MEPTKLPTRCRWGVVATVLASPEEILRFAAHHLDLGAHRIYIHLDAPNADVFDQLKAHPKIRIATCDEIYWRRLGRDRPLKHQERQSVNATRAYQKAKDVDWLVHVDVDEYLVPKRPVDEILVEQPGDVAGLRIHPVELLAGGDGRAYKAALPAGSDIALEHSLYGQYGTALRRGLLSHTAGKIIVRTGLEKVSVRIHRAFQNGREIAALALSDQLELAHHHAATWDDWIAKAPMRLDRGAYRAELKRDGGVISQHDALSSILASDGEAGLRTFFQTVTTDTDVLRSKLAHTGLLRIFELDLDNKVALHFPSSGRI
ncbi:MAG: glycosyltransferase family 2 protein [Pseudomonadota bacterium]